jgi:hypothetical protein
MGKSARLRRGGTTVELGASEQPWLGGLMRAATSRLRWAFNRRDLLGRDFLIKQLRLLLINGRCRQRDEYHSV